MAAADLEARQRNEQLVTHLERSGTLRSRTVAAAFRAVLRHRFLPGRPLDEVYEDAAIMTKIGERGLPVSSSSQPAIMAIMLQLLRLQPGHRVLEIGAGTGYNAALIAHVVGAGGRVVTLDIDADLADQARANLTGAGITGVAVERGDGAAGWPAGAPYDRVIVTAGAEDLSPAWAAQLVDGGRLVLPLSLARPTQHCIGLERHGSSLASFDLCPCGFMPLRGSLAPDWVKMDDVLTGWLGEEGRPTGYSVPASDLQAGFATWLALRHVGFIPAGQRPEGAAPGLGLRDERGAALVADEAIDGRHPVLVFGDGEVVAATLIGVHRSWARERPGYDQIRIAAYPTGAEPPIGASVRVVRRPHFTFLVSS